MVGTQFVVSIFVGFGIGYGLDTHFDTKPVFMLVFIFLGSVSGFLNIYRTLKRKTMEKGN